MTASDRSVFEAARAAWPTLALEEEVFAGWLRVHVRAGDGVRHAADLYLACACVHGVPGAADLFEREVMSCMPVFLRRFHLDAAALDEICQRVRERLLVSAAGEPPRLAAYSGRGPLQAWVRVVAVRAAVDALRSSGGDIAGSGLSSLSDLTDPELAYLKQRYRGEVEDAMRAGIRALDSQQRELLRLNLVDGLSLEEIAVLYRIGKSTAFRWLSAARRQIVAEAQQFLHRRLGVSQGEFASIVDLVRSGLDLSLPRMLVDAPAAK